MLIWLFIILVVVAVIALNVIATSTVADSNIHTEQEKRTYNRIIWAAPVIGVIYTMVAIRKDIKNNQTKVNDDIVSALKDITDNLDSLEAGLKKKQKNNTLH